MGQASDAAAQAAFLACYDRTIENAHRLALAYLSDGDKAEAALVKAYDRVWLSWQDDPSKGCRAVDVMVAVRQACLAV